MAVSLGPVLLNNYINGSSRVLLVCQIGFSQERDQAADRDLQTLLLHRTVVEQGLQPPPSSIIDTLLHHTVNFLSKLLTNFWTISSDHPAWTKVEETKEEEANFKLYIRICKTTVGEMKTVSSWQHYQRNWVWTWLELASTKVIEQLWWTHPVNMPALGAMERSLNGEDDQVVDEKYIGETVVSVKSHQRTDLQFAMSKFAFSCWLYCLALQNNQGGMDNQDRMGNKKFRLFTGDLRDAVPPKAEGYTGMHFIMQPK
jgi:hypothetical protein